MLFNSLHRLGRGALAVVAGSLGCTLPAAADVAAGKAKFNSICAECHDSADFEGEDLNGMRDTLRRIARGEIKHKKTLQLSEQEITDLAAYMASGGK